MRIQGRGLLRLLFAAVLLIPQLACEGQAKVEFNKTVTTEVKLGLHLVPVELNGKQFRFLFDTGAPTSISKAVQKEQRFNVIDRGNIVDSDKNKIRVDYVRVDSVVIEGVKFSNVKAFVADFTANPSLACLELDGILGSNMMQACNWQIDYVSKEIAFSSEPFLSEEPGIYTAKFSTDGQYDLIVDMKMGQASVSNMKIDYGNNSEISVPAKAFKVLVDNKIITRYFLSEGFNQGGIGANPIPIRRYYGYLDSLKLGDLYTTDLALKTGKSGLVGRDFLSRYVVAINWSEKKLRFKPHQSWEDARPTYGYKIGLNSKDEPVLFSVTEGSSAASKKLEVGMRVLKVDQLDFTTGNSYCDYVDYLEAPPPQQTIKVKDKNGQIRQVKLERQLLNKDE